MLITPLNVRCYMLITPMYLEHLNVRCSMLITPMYLERLNVRLHVNHSYVFKTS